MPTYDQLDDEAAWRAERAAPALAALGEALRRHWPGAEIGIRGDNKHLRGYHRSRRWIKESRFCTDHGYSISRTAGDRTGGDSNWACAMDFGGIPQSELHAVCQRLDAAVRAGSLEKITEWYGNFGGDERVDGWDNISDRIASADSSHLTHLHMSFDRGRANEDHADVLAVLIGEDMTPEQIRLLSNAETYAWKCSAGEDPITGILGSDGRLIEGGMPNVPLRLAKAAKAAAEMALTTVSELAARPQVQAAPVDIIALVAALRPELDAAAERAVRKVLGSLDERFPVS